MSIYKTAAYTEGSKGRTSVPYRDDMGWLGAHERALQMR